MFDLASWISPLDGENPSGKSLRDDARFDEIQQMLIERVEVVRDELNNPISQTRVPVDWGKVLEKAEALRTQGRDLRLLVIVARALVNERGFAGLAEGVTLIARTLETHWETLHPELRLSGSPRDAALRRLNALAQLQNDGDGLLGDLRRNAVFAPRGLGAISGRDLERGTLDSRTMLSDAASGLGDEERTRITAEHEQLVARVRTACITQAKEAPDELAALVEAARAATAALAEAERALREKLQLQEEFKELKDLKQFLARVLATLERPITEKPKTDHRRDRDDPPDRLGTREDVIAFLDRIIEFYDRTEPASPIPFLARRMRRMVPMDFLELMEDLAPSGLKEFRSLAGLGEDKKSSHRTQG